MMAINIPTEPFTPGSALMEGLITGMVVLVTLVATVLMIGLLVQIYRKEQPIEDQRNQGRDQGDER